jgi:hypothetical protein
MESTLLTPAISKILRVLRDGTASAKVPRPACTRRQTPISTPIPVESMNSTSPRFTTSPSWPWPATARRRLRSALLVSTSMSPLTSTIATSSSSRYSLASVRPPGRPGSDGPWTGAGEMAALESAYRPRQLPRRRTSINWPPCHLPIAPHELPSGRHRLPCLRPSAAVAGIPRRAVYRRQADRPACGW